MKYAVRFFGLLVFMFVVAGCSNPQQGFDEAGPRLLRWGVTQEDNPSLSRSYEKVVGMDGGAILVLEEGQGFSIPPLTPYYVLTDGASINISGEIDFSSNVSVEVTDGSTVRFYTLGVATVDAP